MLLLIDVVLMELFFIRVSTKCKGLCFLTVYFSMAAKLGVRLSLLVILHELLYYNRIILFNICYIMAGR